MKMKDQFRFVRQNMKKNRTRVYMTILATAMGCAFLIVLASVGFGLQKSVVKEITERRVITQIDVHGKETNDQGGFQPLSDSDIHMFEKIENVKAVTRRKVLQQESTYTIAGYLEGAQTYVAHFPSEIKAGLELSKGKLPTSKNEIVVGYNFPLNLAKKDVNEELYDDKGQVKEEYRYAGNLIGETIDLTIKQFKNGKEEEKKIPLSVVGITKKPTREWMEDRNVYISEKVLREIEGFTGTPKGIMLDPANEKLEGIDANGETYDEVKIYAKNMEAVQNISDQLKDKKYVTYSVVNELKEVNTVFMIAKAGLIFIGTIAILIASIGIYNTMTMAVTERAPDIGIMKAIGATPKTIKRIFLLESSYIGLIGALIGTIVSYGISFAVNLVIPFIIKQAFGKEADLDVTFSSIPPILPIICIVICYGVTILSGYRPAQRATKVDVLKAMRREI
ncbi:acetoin utilization transport system permease protein [Bacillus sp. SORGH_AS 510]|uniref:ABC transporter permease n=1 Tax=Bacillus sp. SORGH_AS_0510 TaxID=3041771 RepID=UPI002787A8A5|nr:FtsX-like permease family protein [Bacillus sp. SORGH_AS_0510]MDQ1146370.1 acetoin utilization transport system permease protein [Bacillus sp. SORGH_AS_0510]